MPFVLFALALAWAIMLLFGGLDLDRAMLALLYSGDKPSLATAARVLTELGGHRVLLPLAAAGAVLLLVRRRFASAAVLVLLVAGGRLLVYLQKYQTARVRPDPHGHLVPVESMSFPSGHAANATIVYLGLAFLLTAHYPRRALAIWAAVWLAILVGASRVALGVHWPTDVIGGWAFGLFWTLLLLRLTGHDIGDGTRRAVPPPQLPPPQGEGEAPRL